MKRITCDDSAVPLESAADLRAASKVSNFLDAFFSLLNGSAIQYCVLRDQVPVGATGRETLELAVRPEHRRELATLFYGLPRERFRPVQCISVTLGTDQFHFALLDDSRPLLIRVDVQYPGMCALLSAVEDELFARSQWQGNCWVAAPADKFSYLLAKAAQLGELTGPEEESFKLSVETLDRAAAEKVAGRLFGLEIQREVVAACSSGSLRAMLSQLRNLDGRNNLPRRIARSLLAVVGNGSRLLRNWFRPNGVLITILGPDGVGKTTLSTTIFDLFGPAFGPRKVLLWRPEVLPRLSKDPSSIDPPHSKPPHGAFESIARIVAIFFDYWLGHFILVKPLLSRSALILYDRDIHDVLVDHRRYRYGGPRWVLTLLTNLLPRTDSLYLILAAAPEVILERKQEVAPTEVRRQLAAYRTLAEDLPNAHLIRTDRDLKSTTFELAQSIVEYLSRRYKRRYVSDRALKSHPRWTTQLQAWAATLCGTSSDLKFNSRSWLQKALLAVLDQGLISGSNFILAILLARWLRAEQYGAYALSFAIFVLCSFLQQGLFLEPMSVFGPSVYRDSQRQYIGTLVWLQGTIVGVALALSTVAVGTFLRYDTGVFRMALLGMAFSAPCVLLYWFARRAFYLQLRPGRAVGGALLYCALLSTAVWLLVRTGRLSAFTAFLAMGVAALLASVRQLWQIRPVIFTSKKKSELQEVAARHWRYGRWAILGSMFIWIPWNVYYPIVGHFSGLAEVANLRALLNLVLPVAQTLSAFSLLFLPHASHASHQQNWDRAKGLALRISFFFALGTAAYWLPVCLFRAPLLQFLYAGHYSQLIRLIPWIALSSFLTGVALGPTIALRAMRSPATVSYIYLISSAVALVLGIPATRLFGISGAVTCNLLSSVTAAVVAWTMLARQGRPAMAARPVRQEAA
jgi:O-antigen/teichoic acid export membrane protein/thymidylate kinase